MSKLVSMLYHVRAMSMKTEPKAPKPWKTWIHNSLEDDKDEDFEIL